MLEQLSHLGHEPHIIRVAGARAIAYDDERLGLNPAHHVPHALGARRTVECEQHHRVRSDIESPEAIVNVIRRIVRRLFRSRPGRGAPESEPRMIARGWDAYAKAWRPKNFVVHDNASVDHLGDGWTWEHS